MYSTLDSLERQCYCTSVQLMIHHRPPQTYCQHPNRSHQLTQPTLLVPTMSSMPPISNNFQATYSSTASFELSIVSSTEPQLCSNTSFKRSSPRSTLMEDSSITYSPETRQHADRPQLLSCPSKRPVDTWPNVVPMTQRIDGTSITQTI